MMLPVGAMCQIQKIGETRFQRYQTRKAIEFREYDKLPGDRIEIIHEGYRIIFAACLVDGCTESSRAGFNQEILGHRGRGRSRRRNAQR